MKLHSNKPELFAAATHFASCDKLRIYISGVHIEPHPVQGAYYVATDGHTMLVGYDETATASKKTTVMIDKPLSAQYFKATELVIQNEIATFNGPKVLVETAKDNNDCFPDWRRIIPSNNVSGEFIGFDWDYLAKFKRVYNYLEQKKDKNPTLLPQGQGPAWVCFGDRTDIVGILMPYRKAVEIAPGIPGEYAQAPIKQSVAA